jgi:hypothetical protein
MTKLMVINKDNLLSMSDCVCHTSFSMFNLQLGLWVSHRVARFAQNNILSFWVVLMDALAKTQEADYSFLPYNAAAINYSTPCGYDVQRHSREYYPTVCALISVPGQTDKKH